MSGEKPTLIDVTIVVPCRNEQKHVVAFMESLLQQNFDGISWEVLIADGMSDDGTRSTLEPYCRQYPVRIVENLRRIVSTGLNEAISQARGRYVIRMDAHTTYAPDYVRQCLTTAEATGADNVGGPWVPRGDGYKGRAIAAVFQSAFGSGGARCHDPGYEGSVDTVYLGCWPREVFQRIGLFDPDLVRNQDDEFNLRLKRSGGEVWQSPRIVSFYRPRSSIRALFRQYMQYGYWKVAVIRKHRLPASIRHLVPGAFVAINAILFLATSATLAVGGGAFSRAVSLGWGLLVGIYLALCLAGSTAAARRHGWTLLPVLPAVFAAYHLGYGYGFLLGAIHSVRSKRASARKVAFTELTR